MSIQTIAEATEKPASIFESNLPLEAKLERARTELLDLSARNRLLTHQSVSWATILLTTPLRHDSRWHEARWTNA